MVLQIKSNSRHSGVSVQKLNSEELLWSYRGKCFLKKFYKSIATTTCDRYWLKLCSLSSVQIQVSYPTLASAVRTRRKQTSPETKILKGTFKVACLFDLLLTLYRVICFKDLLEIKIVLTSWLTVVCFQKWNVCSLLQCSAYKELVMKTDHSLKLEHKTSKGVTEGIQNSNKRIWQELCAA